MSEHQPTPQNGSATTTIYALLHPTTREIRYIGKTDRPHIRLLRHIGDCKRGDPSYRGNWIRSLLAKGLRPTLEIIDEVRADEWQAAEAAYIQFYREEGCRLTNTLPGGDGPGSGPDNAFFGRKHSPETSNKMSAAASKRGPPVIDNAARSRGEKHYLHGKHLAPETRAKLSAALSGEKHPHFGKPKPQAVRAKISEALKGEKHFHFGKKNSPETRAKMSAAQKGRIISTAHRTSLSLAARRRREARHASPNQLSLGI